MVWLIAAFIAGFALDFFWARCVRSVEERRPLLAANLAVLCFLCGLAPPYFLVERTLLPLVAYALGCWAGTFIAVARKT